MKALPGVVLRSILGPALILFTLLGCAAPRAAEPNPERARFETVVDDTYRIRYAFATDHAGFSPEPKGSVTTEPKKTTLLAGIAYPGGWFDRVIFSTMFRVFVLRVGVVFPENVQYERFESIMRAYSSAAEEEMKKTKGSWFLTAPGAEHRVDVNEGWWACVDAVDTKVAPKVRLVSCRRPIAPSLIIGITLTFGKPVAADSDDFTEAMEKLKALAGTISWD